MAAIADVKTRSDSAINQDVILELKWDPKITSNDIAVAVKDGVVTLSGFASSYMEKDAAEKAAKRVYGVRAVANDIQLCPRRTRWQQLVFPGLTDRRSMRAAASPLVGRSLAVNATSIKPSYNTVDRQGTIRRFAFKTRTDTSI